MEAKCLWDDLVDNDNLGNRLHCDICVVNVSCYATMLTHLNGKIMNMSIDILKRVRETAISLCQHLSSSTKTDQTFITTGKQHQKKCLSRGIPVETTFPPHMLKAISEIHQQQIKQEPPEPPPTEPCPVPEPEEDLEEGEIIGPTFLTICRSIILQCYLYLLFVLKYTIR